MTVSQGSAYQCDAGMNEITRKSPLLFEVRNISWYPLCKVNCLLLLLLYGI